MVKKLFFFAVLSVLCGTMHARVTEDAYVDWTTTAWDKYVMGYIPGTNAHEGLVLEWPDYEYKPVSELGEGLSYEIVRLNWDDYYVVPNADGALSDIWGIQCFFMNFEAELGTAYSLTVYAKANHPVKVDARLQWGWGGDDSVPAQSLSIDTEWREVTVNFDPAGGRACDIILQLFDTYKGTAGDPTKVCIKWSKVTHGTDDSPTTPAWKNWLTNGDAEHEWSEVDGVCAYSKTYAGIVNGEQAAQPVPAPMLTEPDGNRCFVARTRAVDPYEYPSYFFDRYDIPEDHGNYVDVTRKYLKDPTFVPGWQGVIGAADGSVAEVWNGAFRTYQNLGEMPAGTYILTANAFYRCGNNDYAKTYQAGNPDLNTCYLFINDAKVPVVGLWEGHESAPNSMWEANEAFAAGEYLNTVEYQHPGGELVIGICNTGCYWDEWSCFDNFKLKCDGVNIPITNGDFSEGLNANRSWDNINSAGSKKTPDVQKDGSGGGDYRKCGGSPYNTAQQVTLPAGTYRFSMQCFHRYGSTVGLDGTYYNHKWPLNETEPYGSMKRTPKDWFEAGDYDAVTDGEYAHAYIYMSKNADKPRFLSWDDSDDEGDLVNGVDARWRVRDCWEICNGDLSIMPQNNPMTRCIDNPDYNPDYEVKNKVLYGNDSGSEREAAAAFVNDPEKWRQGVEFTLDETTPVWLGLGKDANTGDGYWHAYSNITLEMLDTDSTGGSDPDPGTLRQDVKWMNQFWIQSPKAWEAGDEFKLSFRYKASQNCTVETQVHKQKPGDYLHWAAIGDVYFTTEWRYFEMNVKVSSEMAGMWSIAFNFGTNDNWKDEIDFFFDDLKWETEETSSGGDYPDRDIEAEIADDWGYFEWLEARYQQICYWAEEYPAFNESKAEDIQNIYIALFDIYQIMDKAADLYNETGEYESPRAYMEATAAKLDALERELDAALPYLDIMAHDRELIYWLEDNLEGACDHFADYPGFYESKTEEIYNIRCSIEVLWELWHSRRVDFWDTGEYESIEGGVEEVAAQITSLWDEFQAYIEDLESGTPIEAADLAALVAVQQELESAFGWQNVWGLTGSEEKVGDLPGVTITDGKVTAIDLSRTGLKGQNDTAIFPTTILALPNVASINLSGNNLSGDVSAALYALALKDPRLNGKITQLDISHNAYTGNVGTLGLCFPNLTTLDVSYNQFDTVYPELSKNITTLDISHQTIDKTIDLDRSNLNPMLIASQIPTIIVYDHSIRNYRKELNMMCTDSKEGSFVDDGENWVVQLKYQDGKISMPYVSQQNCFKLKSGDRLDVVNLYPDDTEEGSRFHIRFYFAQGDANFDGAIDISDLQSMILKAFEAYPPRVLFNLTAANLYDADDIINVQDVVLMVDLLAAQEPSASAQRTAAKADGTSLAYCHDGRLYISSSEPVAAFDVTVLGDIAGDILPMLDHYGLDYRIVRTPRYTRIIAYSLTGATLPAGVTAIAETGSQRVAAVMLVDGHAREITEPSVISALDAINADGAISVRCDSGILRIATDDASLAWTLYGLDGAVYARGTEPETNIRHIPEGCYIVTVKTDSASLQSTKIIIKK